MDISDKIINVCIIFAILAILSIIFGCYYFSGKSENFKNTSLSDENSVIKQLITMLANTNTPDSLILNLMKKHKAYFKNEKFVTKVVEQLKEAEEPETPKESKESKKPKTLQKIPIDEQPKVKLPKKPTK
jgi:hypothetical protein